MREALCSLLSSRTAHFASNLGVVELSLALHTTFDFQPRPPDLGHRPPDLSAQADHRPLPRFGTIRTKGGLMGYPNPAESDYDLFMTGHAGCSVSTALGLKCGDDLLPGQARSPRRGRHRRRGLPLGHRLRGHEQRRRLEEEAARRPERQQDVDLPARRRPGRIRSTGCG